jgi:glutathione peroxidase
MSLYDIPVKGLDGSEQTLEPYRGKVLLIVNVASRCSFTPQYAGLEELYRRFQDRGFAILGFPCNQFLHQEPGDELEIKQFCSLKYDVTFPVFAKVDVNGSGTHTLYQHLKSAARGTLGTHAIKWNFTKFLVDREGNVVRRYSFFTKPGRIATDIEELLNR